MQLIIAALWPLVVLIVVFVIENAYCNFIKMKLSKESKLDELELVCVNLKKEIKWLTDCNAEIHKQAEETKKLLSTHNLAQAFKR